MKSKSSRTSADAAAGKGAGIVCGTDFTDNAQQAARVAAAIAKRLDEPVQLVHALDFPGYASKGKVAGVFRLVRACPKM
ncbi:MAG: hypothetical protein FJ403_16155 [Verrucomicrobia bacterium]|nr:hypothetical protein [Verrucomicrobiota bacterium]